MMTPDELIKLLRVLRENRVLKFKTAELELELSPAAFLLAPEAPTSPITDPIGAAEGYPTEDEFLYMSSAYPMDAKASPPDET